MNLKTTYSRLSAALVIVLITLGALSSKQRKASWDTLSLERKAGYAYIQALDAMLDGDNSSFYSLVARASELDPKDVSIANDMGMLTLQLEGDDSVAVRRSLAMLRRYFDSNPADIFSGLRYAGIVGHLGDTREALRVYRILHSHYPDHNGLTQRYAERLAEAGGIDSIDHVLALYDTLEIVEGPSLDLAAARIQMYYLRNDTPAVIAEGHRQLDFAPKAVENNVFMAQLYALFNHNDSARIYFDRAIEIDSLDARASYSRAMFYHSIGDSVAFDREIFRVLRLEDLDMNTKIQVLHNYVSELYNDSTQQPRVISLFDRLTAIHPHEPEIRKLYALYLASGPRLYHAAAEQQDMGMSLEPDDETGWNRLGIYNVLDSNRVQAISALRRGLHYFPESTDMMLSLGVNLFEADSLDEARSVYRQALELTDSSDVFSRSDILMAMGDMYAAREDTDSAITLYRQALRVNPLNAMALNNCAYFLAVKGRDLDDALAMIEKSVADDPGDPTRLDTYAWVAFKRRDYEKARLEIDKALELSPEPSAEILEHAGDIYFFSGEPARALEFWEKAAALDPANKLLERKVKDKTYYYE